MAFLLTMLASVLICHTLATRLERRGRSAQRRARQAAARRRRDELPVDLHVIRALRRS
jgi:hypothetical protein